MQDFKGINRVILSGIIKDEIDIGYKASIGKIYNFNLMVYEQFDKNGDVSATYNGFFYRVAVFKQDIVSLFVKKLIDRESVVQVEGRLQMKKKLFNDSYKFFCQIVVCRPSDNVVLL